MSSSATHTTSSFLHHHQIGPHDSLPIPRLPAAPPSETVDWVAALRDENTKSAHKLLFSLLRGAAGAAASLPILETAQRANEEALVPPARGGNKHEEVLKHVYGVRGYTNFCAGNGTIISTES